ncbi:small nuclear ribonucleoprotein E isoform X3 [Hippopotamus amphibius kiboko]|uniref:small nuclear ribonucleoprotein E isoform X3 n=1 Tax=Hippopotamus amphibius kiboko TaxID=575201 RepID=UPI002598DD19|nr:small nuclear ribonucleoprotein E isoform X3 [Hippopotamus amphibius kiboko]
MAYRGQGQKVQKVMVQPIRSRIQVWLYEQVNMRIEGCIIGFDEYMNLVLDDAEEIHSKTKSRKQLAGRRKELDWTVSSRGQLSPSRNWKLRGSQQLYQVNKEGHLLTSARISRYFGDISKWEEFTQICKAKVGMAFLAVKRPFKSVV